MCFRAYFRTYPGAIPNECEQGSDKLTLECPCRIPRSIPNKKFAVRLLPRPSPFTARTKASRTCASSPKVFREKNVRMSEPAGAILLFRILIEAKKPLTLVREGGLIFALVTTTASGATSNANVRRPSSTASNGTVPFPQNGSSTRSPSELYFRIKCRARAGGIDPGRDRILCNGWEGSLSAFHGRVSFLVR